MAWALHDAIAIKNAGPTGRLTLHRQPSGEVFQPNAGVWQTAKANGAASLLTAGKQNWLEELAQLENATFVSNSSSLGQLRAAYASLEQTITGRATETPPGALISPASIRHNVRSSWTTSGSSPVAREIFCGAWSPMTPTVNISSPLRLSDAIELKRFFALYTESQKANPELRCTFAAK